MGGASKVLKTKKNENILNRFTDTPRREIMEYKTTLDPAEPAPRGTVRGVSSGGGGGSPSQK